MELHYYETVKVIQYERIEYLSISEIKKKVMWQKYQHCLRININLISHLSAKAVKQNLNIAKKCEHWDLQNNKT